MTQPPTWGTPPGPQQPGGWPGQPGPGGQPGVPGQPYPQGQYPSGPGFPQQPWPAPVPPKRGGPQKWIFGVLGALVLVVVTAVVAVSCVKSDGGGTNAGGAGGKSSGAASDVASANDTGPVGIITEDPSCAAWGPIANTLAGVERNGWLNRDPSIPATAWTPEVRAQHEAVGVALRKAADQTLPLAKMTTHRVMRELYGQSMVYGRAYADSIATYTPLDDNLARAASTAGSVIADICNAISSGSAAARASLIPSLPAPVSVAPIGDLSNPKRIFETPDVVCSDLGPAIDQLRLNPTYQGWLKTDPSIPVANWSPEQRALTDAVGPAMTSLADALEKLAAKSSNPVVSDFILLGVQYQRTYVEALPTYQPNDDSIRRAGQEAAAVVSMACKYATG